MPWTRAELSTLKPDATKFHLIDHHFSKNLLVQASNDPSLQAWQTTCRKCKKKSITVSKWLMHVRTTLPAWSSSANQLKWRLPRNRNFKIKTRSEMTMQVPPERERVTVDSQLAANTKTSVAKQLHKKFVKTSLSVRKRSIKRQTRSLNYLMRLQSCTPPSDPNMKTPTQIGRFRSSSQSMTSVLDLEMRSPMIKSASKRSLLLSPMKISFTNYNLCLRV